MKIVSNQCVLFIEPSKNKSGPILDELTMKMLSALEYADQHREHGSVLPGGQYTPGLSTMGVHTCICGATSDSCDYYLKDIHRATNSLAAHYLAYHREEIPESELKIIACLPNTTKDWSTSTFL